MASYLFKQTGDFIWRPEGEKVKYILPFFQIDEVILLHMIKCGQATYAFLNSSINIYLFIYLDIFNQTLTGHGFHIITRV